MESAYQWIIHAGFRPPRGLGYWLSRTLEVRVGGVLHADHKELKSAVYAEEQPLIT